MCERIRLHFRLAATTAVVALLSANSFAVAQTNIDDAKRKPAAAEDVQ